MAPLKPLDPGNRVGVIVAEVWGFRNSILKLYLPCGRFCPKPLPHIKLKAHGRT